MAMVFSPYQRKRSKSGHSVLDHHGYNTVPSDVVKCAWAAACVHCPRDVAILPKTQGAQWLACLFLVRLNAQCDTAYAFGTVVRLGWFQVRIVHVVFPVFISVILLLLNVSRLFYFWVSRNAAVRFHTADRLRLELTVANTRGIFLWCQNRPL